MKFLYKTIAMFATINMIVAKQSYADTRPVKVFILAGQSNMQGHARISTIDTLADDPKTAYLLKELKNNDGSPKVFNNVWISSIGCGGNQYSDLLVKTGKLTSGFGASESEIGPEYTFGIYAEKIYGGPILIIKTSWGGRNLHTDFRPPSAGAEVINSYTLEQWKRRGQDPEKEAAKVRENGGVFYKHMMDHVKKTLANIKQVIPNYDPNQGYELSGFAWFQGFNDLVDSWTYLDRNRSGGYAEYGNLLSMFIKDVRTELNAPNLPFVIGVMGIGGSQEGNRAPQMYFRHAQASPASLPEFKGNVVAVETSKFWDDTLDALQQRKEKLNEWMEAEFKKTPKITEEEKEIFRKKCLPENFTPMELKLMKGISNGGYHYLGAARILAPIGKAFAEALASIK